MPYPVSRIARVVVIAAGSFSVIFAMRTDAETPQEVEQAIRESTRDFVSGYNSGDVDRLMRFYADHYVDINLPNPIQTREERTEYYRKIVQKRNTEVEVTPDEIVVDGLHAAVRGTILIFKLDAQGKRGKPLELRYMELAEKQPSGWKAIWGMDADLYQDNNDSRQNSSR